jgi:hypothetical protein
MDNIYKLLMQTDRGRNKDSFAIIATFTKLKVSFGNQSFFGGPDNTDVLQ